MKKFGMILLVLVLACGVAGADTVTNFTGSAAVLPDMGLGAGGVQNTIDFTAHPCVTGDVFQVIGVPSNCTVLVVSYHVNSTNTPVDLSTFDIGDDASRTRFKSGATMAIAGTTEASHTGYTYTTNNTIDVTSYGTITNGTLTVWATITKPPHLP